MSKTPTAGKATFIKSGLCVMVAPTKSPPFDPPLIAKYSDEVYLFSIKYSAAAMKSSKTFCLFIFVPASCHVLPYSPPPLKLGTAYTPPCSIQTALNGLKLGVKEILKPPYP